MLDLRKLKYEWGDGMGRVLGTIPRPRAVLISDLNRKGMKSLIREDLFCGPNKYLFDHLSDALAACHRQYVAELDRERRELNTGDDGDVIK